MPHTDTLSDWGDTVSNTLDEWADALADGVYSAMKATAGFVEDAGRWIKDTGNQYLDATKVVTDVLKIPVRFACDVGPDITDFTDLTQEGCADWFFETVDFHRDKE